MKLRDLLRTVNTQPVDLDHEPAPEPRPPESSSGQGSEVKRFIAQQCQRQAGARDSHAELYLAFKLWGGSGDGDEFGAQLERLGFHFDESTLQWSGLRRKCLAMTLEQFRETHGYHAPAWPKPEEYCESCGFHDVNAETQICEFCGKEQEKERSLWVQ